MPVEIDCTAPGPGAGDQCSAETPCADGWTCSDALFAGQGAGTSSYYCYAEPDGAAGCAGSNEYALPFAPNGSAWGCVPLGHFRASFDLVVVQAGRQPGQRDMKPLTDYEADFSCEPYLQGMQRVQLGVEVAQDGLDVVQLSFSAIKLTPPTMQNVSVVIPSSRWVPGTTLELSPADPEAFGAQVVTAELALNGMQSSVKAATLEGLVAGGTVVIDEINGNGATGHVDIRFILVRAELDPDLMAM
jgi:hypothetical protein